MTGLTTIPHLGAARLPLAIDLTGTRSGGDAREGRRVRVISPCFNGAKDVQILLNDLATLDLGRLSDGTPEISLSVLVVDNASTIPISQSVRVPEGLDVTFLRLKSNTGGSGGYNAGMAHSLREGRDTGRMPEFLWLLDSDARPADDLTLLGLVRAMDANPAFTLMGSSIANPETGVVFEIGGTLDSFVGQFHPRWGEENPPPKRTVEVTYAAACSCLVRAETVTQVGLFPDVFLNGDDVEWSVTLAKQCKGKVGATCDSVVRHPQYKFGQTLPRYFIARNGFGPIDALKMGPRVRFFRALREVPRALAQVMIGRPDLAECHIRGLEDAAARRFWGAGAKDSFKIDKFVTFTSLASALERHIRKGARPEVWMHGRIRLTEQNAREIEGQLESLGLDVPPVPRGPYILERERFMTGVWAGFFRFLRGPKHEVAVIPVRGRPNAWARGRVQVEVTPDGYVIRDFRRWPILKGLVNCGLRGIRAATMIGLRRTGRTLRDRLPDAATYAYDVESETRVSGVRAGV